mmetsp:Transcript_28552/g.77018  ORF Transcript_28552/g.77018 Transcript_28552/m.77018 type:complete len:223 (-) Transcript_28552:545-1213(-)
MRARSSSATCTAGRAGPVHQMCELRGWPFAGGGTSSTRLYSSLALKGIGLGAFADCAASNGTAGVMSTACSSACACASGCCCCWPCSHSSRSFPEKTGSVRGPTCCLRRGRPPFCAGAAARLARSSSSFGAAIAALAEAPLAWLAAFTLPAASRMHCMRSWGKARVPFTLASSSFFWKSPDWSAAAKSSEPPTLAPPTNTCGTLLRPTTSFSLARSCWSWST